MEEVKKLVVTDKEEDLINIESDIEFLKAYLRTRYCWISEIENRDETEFINANKYLETPEANERCAQLADLAMIEIVRSNKKVPTDGNLFRILLDHNLLEDSLYSRIVIIRKQILAIPKIITKIKYNPELFAKKKSTEPETPNESESIKQSHKTTPNLSKDDSTIVLTETDLNILQCLKGQNCTRTQDFIMAEVDRSRNTIKKSLDKLRELGFITRPDGPRTGEAITKAGRQHIESKKPPKD